MQGTGDTPGTIEVDTKQQLAARPSTSLANSDQEYLDKQEEAGFPELSFQFQAFGNEYITNGFDHRKAAVSVGKPANRALSILRNPLVRRYISYLQSLRNDQSLITLDFLDAKLEELQDIAMGETAIPIVLADGTMVVERKFMGDLAFKCIEKRGKLSGHEKPDLPGGGAGGGVVVNIDVNALLGKSSPVTIEGEVVECDTETE